jgi:hypothetical protein
MIKQSLRVVVSTLAIGLLAGCQLFTSTTDGVSKLGTSTTDMVSSTSPGGKSAEAFINTRYAAIRTEAAQGGGEHIDSLAALLNEPDRAAFARWMKDNYAGLFGGANGPQDLVKRIEERRKAG